MQREVHMEMNHSPVDRSADVLPGLVSRLLSLCNHPTSTLGFRVNSECDHRDYATFQRPARYNTILCRPVLKLASLPSLSFQLGSSRRASYHLEKVYFPSWTAGSIAFMQSGSFPQARDLEV
jgi:hypothetical protein